MIFEVSSWLRTLILALGLSVSLATTVLADESDDTPECPADATRVVRDHGAALGCERTDKRGVPVRVGPWQWRDAEGHVLYSMTYSDWGVEDGVATEFNGSGAVIRRLQYTDGKLEGASTTWWPDGHKREETTYRDGKMHGVRKRWTYAPRGRKQCTRADESCWMGSEECWVGGERRPHEACNDLYANSAAGKKRAPAAQ